MKVRVARTVAVKARGWEGCGALRCPRCKLRERFRWKPEGVNVAVRCPGCKLREMLRWKPEGGKVAVRCPGCKLRGELSEMQVARKGAGGEATPVGQAPEPDPARDGGLYRTGNASVDGSRSARIARTVYKVPGGVHEKAHGGGAVASTFL